MTASTPANVPPRSGQAEGPQLLRCAFAAAGLLDATRIHVPDQAASPRHDLTSLILADHVYGVANRTGRPESAAMVGRLDRHRGHRQPARGSGDGGCSLCWEEMDRVSLGAP